MLGCVSVAVIVAAALFFRRHPGPTIIDRWAFEVVNPSVGRAFYVRVTELRSEIVLVAGSVLAALVVVARDRLRAVACLVGPGLAVVLVEWILKPVVARRYAEVLSFPSGTTTVIASLVTAWVLAVPRRFRPFVVTVGTVLVGLECIAVVALQWHFPTDGLGGVVVGVGVILLIDGLLHVAARSNGAAGPGS